MSDEPRESIFEGNLYFNGINGVTGDYGLKPMSSERLARIIKGQADPKELDQLRGEQRHPETLAEEQRRKEEEEERIHLAELKDKNRRRAVLVDAPAKEGVDPTRLDQAGWAVVFPAKMETSHREAIKQALKPLLDLRQKQAGELYRVFEGPQGYRPGERKDQFFAHQDPEVRPGPADPEQMPFYVLLVGSPEEISFKFQYQLDVMRGVGRIDFGDDLDAYAQYAQNVVMAEAGKVKLGRQATFFGAANPGDPATELSARYLVRPLYENLQKPKLEREIELKFDWELKAFVGKNLATKAQLKRLLGGDPAQTPALLLTASHGMEFPLGHSQQLDYQGALLCQDWPGPGGTIARDHYFTAEDLTNDANVLGMIAFFFACYGAGTPRFDQFAKQAFKTRETIAPYGFVAALPRRLLSQGALAVLGHVERAWGYSFVSPSGAPDNQAFVTALRKLLNGEPVGLATDPSFDMRYADMSSALSANLEELEWDPNYISDYELAHIWTANNDARGYIVIGDPAVRIPFALNDETPTERPSISQVSATLIMPRMEAELAPVKPRDEPQQGPEPYQAKAAMDFGLQVSGLTGSIKQFTNQLASALSKAASNITTLEVSTYTTNDIDTVAQGDEGRAKLRAYTRVAFDGDTKIYVPAKVGSIEEDLWKLHAGMVREAQANRAQFLQSMAELATNLLKNLNL